MFDPESLLIPHLRKMDEYVPIQPFEVLSQELGYPPEQLVKLDANENPYGPPQCVLDAISEYPFYHIYPDPEQQALRQAISDAYQIPYESLAMGSGADELLDYICRFCLSPQDSILDLPPTFGMYKFDAQLAGASVLQVWRRADFSVDLKEVETAVAKSHEEGNSRIKIVFVTSPNNPSGTWFPDEDLRRLIELPVLVVLDEAYVDFAVQKTRMSWVTQYPNLVVLRTFSKAMGIAGLRLGFGVFPDWLIAHFWRCKQPYNVSALAATAGLASLQNLNEVHQVVDRLRNSRTALLEGIQGISYLQAFPSEGNFVLCRVVGRSAGELWQELRKQGILLRYFNKPGLEDCLRISIGRTEQMDLLLAVLKSMET